VFESTHQVSLDDIPRLGVLPILIEGFIALCQYAKRFLIVGLWAVWRRRAHD
jgi:hypothetical protein